MSKSSVVLLSVTSANSVEELASALDGLTANQEQNVTYGVTNATKASRKKANAEAKAILQRVGTDHTLLTEDDKDKLRAYSGLGGIGGSVHEYYTPDFVAKGVWDALKVNGFENGNVGEPSAGAGVFNGTKPKGVIITGSEMDATSSQINQLLHPEDKIFNKTFEQLAQIVPDHHFDAMTGNVPFSRSRSTAHDDPEYASIKEAERYFITRMIDKCKPNAPIVCVVPTQIIDRKSWSSWREDISRKAEFLGAHRLPEGIFKDSGTDVVTDVIVLRKHSEETATAIQNLSDKDLQAANVLWDTFISGKYFKSAEGKRFIHGEEVETTNRFGGLSTSVKNDGRITQDAIQAKLSRKFESRINYAAINTSEPVIKNYVEGDQRKINGRWYQLKGGEWEVVSVVRKDGTIDKEQYGVSSQLEAKQVLDGGVDAVSNLSFDQVSAIIDDFSYMLEDADTNKVVRLHQFAMTLKPQYRERVFRGSLIGEQIIALQDQAARSRKVPTAMAAQLRELVAVENERYGIASRDPSIASLAGTNSNQWNAFSNSTSPSGEYSDLLKGTLDVGETIDFDTNNASHVITQLHLQFDLNPVPFEEFEKLYTGSDKPKSLSDVAMLEGVAITPEGNLMPFDRATCGEVVKTTARLRKALGSENDPNIINNIERQLQTIEAKRKRSEPKDIEFTLKAKWIPREYILAFLKDTGYNDFAYVKTEQDDEGNDYVNDEYHGEDGLFAGYTTHKNGKKRSANPEIAFERQFENYLNGLPVRSKDRSAAARYKDRIKVIEQQFGDWIRQHDDADLLTDKFNDTFNGYIPFEHSTADLGLTNVSDSVKLLTYQNSAIRQASEDGKGIIALGTGLGKTYSALGLIAYNTQLGRSKRTCVVVPKSVLENWYHEIKSFYGRENMGGIFIPAVDPVADKDGNIEQELILDEKGQPKINEHTGQEQYRDKIKLVTSGKVIKERLAKIPQSNYSVVVLTKEQFSKLPLRPESVGEHVANRVAAGALKGKYVSNAKNYTEAQKNENFKAKYSDVGTKKYDDVPYFEDMAFDTVIVDEGHNYRNSYEAGFRTGQLAYLPTAPSSDVAVDMALKSEYVRKNNGGRGTILLTATPTVNSPNDIYNMLSLVMSPEEWANMGITDVDDFIEMYGETSMESITKLSGEVEEKEALVGFKNLSGLRNLFHRWVNMKDAKSVGETVKIPTIIESKSIVELSDEQKRIYEELRERADNLNEETKSQDVTLPDGTTLSMDVPNGDTIFGIIRDMDRVATDIDLYNKTMTFVLPKSDKQKLEKAIEKLPTELLIGGDKENPVYASPNAELSVEGDSIKLVVHEAFESALLDAMADSGVKSKDISHPVPPKYAHLIELVRNGLKDGKQIIFTEEKTQHQKLKRIISHQLDINASEIGVINADTVSGKKKNASEEDQEKGLEAIANNYNTGKHRILIANKKAEVGINLHHGTTDLYHLTLPWTPASIKQRNGRGARVGSKENSLRVHYMLGNGSFDEYRLSALQRKQSWQTDLFTSNEEKMKNADAVADKEEMSLLLAADPAERAARDAKARKAKEAKIRQEKKRLALVDVANFIKASHDTKYSVEELNDQLSELNNQRVDAKVKLDEAQLKQRRLRYYQEHEHAQVTREIKDLDQDIKNLDRSIKSLSVKLKRADKAAQKLKQLKPQIDSAIESGLIDVDKSFVEQASNSIYDFEKSRIISIGEQYEQVLIDGSPRNRTITRRIVQIESIDIDLKIVKASILYTPNSYSSKNIGDKVEIELSQVGKQTNFTESELDIKAHLRTSLSLGAATIKLNKADFAKYLKSGELELDRRSGLIVRDGEGFDVIHYDYQKHADNIVYPDSKDESLKKELAPWLLSSKHLRGYTMIEEYLKVLFGANYVATVESYGVQATPQKIEEWINEQLKEKATPDVRQSWLDNMLENDNKYMLPRPINSVFDVSLVKEKYDNISAFESAVSKRVDALVNEVVAAAKAKKERDNELLKQRVATFDGKANNEVFDRLKWLYSSSLWGHGNARKLLPIEGGDSEYHQLSIDDRYAALYSDFKRLGITTHLSAEIKRSVHSTLGSDYMKSKYFDALESLQANEPVNEPVSEPVKERAEAAEQVIEKAESTPETISSVTVALNTKPINVESQKVRRGRRWVSTKALSYGVGEVYCLHDPAGKDGALYKNREELKATAGKGAYTFATDLTDDYPDAWWFFDSNAITLEQITGILEG